MHSDWENENGAVVQEIDTRELDRDAVAKFNDAWISAPTIGDAMTKRFAEKIRGL